MTSLREYYHLKKDAFDIDPRRDAEVYFGYQSLQDRILQRLAADFVQQRHVPKFFIYGRYGGGKTHTLSHIQHLLRHDRDSLGIYQETEPILAEVPPLRAKEQWKTMHEHFLDTVGKALVKEAIQALVAEAGGDVPGALRDHDVLRFGEASLQASQASIFRAMLFGGHQETTAWEWLKGKALSTDQAATLQTETNLTRPSDYLAALLNVASLIHKGLRRKVVLLIDEAESIRSVTNPDSLQEFIWAFRRLVDNENDVLGLIVGFQTEGGMEDAPGVFTDEAVITRIGDAGFIDLGELVAEETDAKNFIVSVLDRLVDQEAAKTDIEAHGLSTEPEYFPFTLDAVDLIANHVVDDPEHTSPRWIKNTLADAVIRAWQEGRDSGRVLIIDDALAEKALYPADGA